MKRRTDFTSWLLGVDEEVDRIGRMETGLTYIELLDQRREVRRLSASITQRRLAQQPIRKD